MDSIKPHEIYTVYEAGTLLGVHERTVYRYIERGWIDVQEYPSGTIRIVGAALLAFQKASYTRARVKNNCTDQLVFSF